MQNTKLASTVSSDALYRLLGAPKLSLALFALLAALGLPISLVSANKPFILAAKIVFCGIWLNLFICTIQRWRRLRWPVVVLHLAGLVILAGGLVSSFGCVATVNIYEGESSGVAYRWDLGRDIPLGMVLQVEDIQQIYYPAGIKIGVLFRGEKHELAQVVTGRSFTLDGYRVQAASLDVDREEVILKIYRREDNSLLGLWSSLGSSTLPPDFAYDFRLVAFQTPTLKNFKVKIAIRQQEQKIYSGDIAINSPLLWHGWRIYPTGLNHDETGHPYVGLQIVRDPGISLVYIGFAMAVVGLAAHFIQLCTKRRT